jgi:hypothetical protein
MAFKLIYVTVYCELVSKYYGTVCVKVETVITTEILVSVSTVCFHSTVRNGRIRRFSRPYMDFSKHLRTAEIVS